MVILISVLGFFIGIGCLCWGTNSGSEFASIVMIYGVILIFLSPILLIKAVNEKHKRETTYIPSKKNINSDQNYVDDTVDDNKPMWEDEEQMKDYVRGRNRSDDDDD